MSDLPGLTVADFPAFFDALWRTEAVSPSPFPWQEQLVAQLADERCWPALVDLPTGSGKTSLLEIALFLQALDAERPPSERWMPRRVVLVVDRRVVVDQADDRGRHIARRLGAATDGVLHATAVRLRYLFDGAEIDPPLVTTVLRGGIVRDESWARRPDVPAIVSSTVDQVGSRLLFRGYGVSATMRPVQAGLLANDCLFLLDEVHLARPFAETLAAIHRYRGWAERSDAIGCDRWQVVELSATPTHAVGKTRFPARPLDPDSHPVLGRRLRAAKPATLAQVDLPKDRKRADRAFAERCTREAIELLGDDRTRTIGVVVNRVDTARTTADLLDAAIGSGRTEAPETDVVLLTGRMRPFDRDRIIEAHRERVSIGRERHADDRRLIVVATQCIEAGADFDLDGLVTECASLDALRQRFGRVDRDGRLAADGQPSRSVILARGPLVSGAVDDPVYGGALAETWRWLATLDEVDFGITALSVPEGEELARLSPPRRRAPRLLPAHLDAWVQTSPAPAVEPNVGHWLHGIEEPAVEVQVAWRADLTEALMRSAPRVAAERVRACPPVSREALTLPLTAVRRWLLGHGLGDLADVEGIEVVQADDVVQDRASRRVVRWVGTESEVVEPRQIRPGDLIVVPSAYGGLARGSWSPESQEPVSDVATEAMATQRRLAVLRLVPALWPSHRPPDLERYARATARERQEIIDAWLEEQLTSRVDDEGSALDKIVMQVLATRPSARKVQIVGGHELGEEDEVSSLVITAPLGVKDTLARPAVAVAPLPLEAEGDSDATSFTGVSDEVLLDQHLAGVSWWAGGLADRAGLSPALADDLRLAGRLHDVGKADVRFQLLLRGGDEVALAASCAPLAKSSTPSYDRASRAAARKRSGYPLGARHETMSIAMCEHAQDLAASSHDWELVLHLVASSHGLCRPCAPIMHDDDPQQVSHTVGGRTFSASSDHQLARMDSGVADRFWRLVHRYGWFGLAWLETIFRLADHRQSEAEALRGRGGG